MSAAQPRARAYGAAPASESIPLEPFYIREAGRATTGGSVSATELTTGLRRISEELAVESYQYVYVGRLCVVRWTQPMVADDFDALVSQLLGASQMGDERFVLLFIPAPAGSCPAFQRLETSVGTLANSLERLVPICAAWHVVVAGDDVHRTASAAWWRSVATISQSRIRVRLHNSTDAALGEIRQIAPAETDSLRRRHAAWIHSGTNHDEDLAPVSSNGEFSRGERVSGIVRTAPQLPPDNASAVDSVARVLHESMRGGDVDWFRALNAARMAVEHYEKVERPKLK